MSRVGFIGTGHIAAPIARFLHSKGHQITVSERNADTAADLQGKIGAKIEANQGVIDNSDIVFLCLRPTVAEQAIKDLTFRADQRIISVMAGVPEAKLRELCAPASQFVQTIPLGFLEQGGCPLAAYGNDALLAELFEPENPVVKVGSETSLNAHFAICAFVPGVLDLMHTASSWLADQTGDVKSAEFFTSQLLGGFLEVMDKDAVGFLQRERDALATDGTLSLQMTTGLKEGGTDAVLLKTLTAIGERLSK